jgi:phosphoenolpyruvate synthase/pyruvate phosphate dikinase
LLKRPPYGQRIAGELVMGQAASAGEGKVVFGQASFNPNHYQTEQNGHRPTIFMAPFTEPRHLEAIRHAKAVVTTGGGLLSHAAITTREFGIPAVIINRGRWSSSGGRPVLTIDVAVPGAAEQRLESVWISDRLMFKTVEIHEGDVLLVDGRSGFISVFDHSAQDLLREFLELWQGAVRSEAGIGYLLK